MSNPLLAGLRAGTTWVKAPFVRPKVNLTGNAEIIDFGDPSLKPLEDTGTAETGFIKEYIPPLQKNDILIPALFGVIALGGYAEYSLSKSMRRQKQKDYLQFSGGLNDKIVHANSPENWKELKEAAKDSNLNQAFKPEQIQKLKDRLLEGCMPAAYLLLELGVSRPKICIKIALIMIDCLSRKPGIANCLVLLADHAPRTFDLISSAIAEFSHHHPTIRNQVSNLQFRYASGKFAIDSARRANLRHFNQTVKKAHLKQHEPSKAALTDFIYEELDFLHTVDTVSPRFYWLYDNKFSVNELQTLYDQVDGEAMLVLLNKLHDNPIIAKLLYKIALVCPDFRNNIESWINEEQAKTGSEFLATFRSDYEKELLALAG
jgi:hypothetical protein